MKRFVLSVIAFCFILAGNSDAFSQTRKISQKRTKAKLVKCYEKGKVVYRTKCRLRKKAANEVKLGRFEPKDEPYGVVSNGNGTGGGTGNGKGQGTGQGNGDGAGLGNGNGDGNGRGDTSTDKKDTNLPNVPIIGVKILSKPRPIWSDLARENKVTGKVVLRVTFSANGTIGGISVISGLGYGLTERAIAAARQIKFEPATRGGVPYSITKAIEYNFTPE